MKVLGFDRHRVELGMPGGRANGVAWAGVGAPVAMELGERLWPKGDPWSFHRDRDGPGKEENMGTHGIRKTKGRWCVEKDGYMLR